MKFATNAFGRTLLTAAGLIVGFIGMVLHITATDFPVDMIIYREGVRAFLNGTEVYSVPMQAGDIALPFIYPPFGALVMVPLTAFEWMSDDMAGNIMIVISDALVLACLYAIFRALKIKPLLPVVALVWAATMFFEPIRLNNGFAQINIVIMALVIFDLVPRKRWLPQGWLIGLAAAIKITPLAMLLYFLLRREWKPILTAFVSAVVATLLAAAYRWDAFVEFFTSKLLDMGSGGDFGVGTAYQSNSSLKGVIQRLFTSQEAMDNHGTLINVVWLVAALTVIAGGSALIMSQVKHGLLVDAHLTTATVMLLISPVSWSHHWVWLSLIVPVLVYRAWTWRQSTWVAGSLLAVLAAWVGMLVTVPGKWWFGDNIDVHTMPLYQKFLVDDFVWLALLTWALYAICLKVKDTQADKPHAALAATPTS
ncbi:glycosyltransferase 87 family protein [Corynebacterium sp. MSK218]|uniref:glycosyltransferase 87 family protein n=1 Tax=Corynebacterium sp. MSK218 TaxID=3050218 RepID=UPI0025512916|nr:glycosyltransferase 87 family protein [Corynebacterium sp. MSK218]MDK8762786.1 glycosyltransferase 87 family protein [Corynebacterium sp. MSK218]